MTYNYYNYYNNYHNYDPYEEYKFTAFTESDLVKGNLDCGDTFYMPSCSSVSITVKDDDKYLSGDSKCDENADDKTGQKATIEDSNGNELGNGGQIYGEVYWWVKDQAGNWYVMIEIEQEGTGGDYFTFYTGSGYGVPPAGTKLTVHSSENIKDCGWSPEFYKLDAGECDPATGSISGTVFCDTNCDGINGVVKVIPGCDYTIEAEKMWDCGFETFYSSTASGGKAVKLKCAGGYGELATCFDGKDGKYDVKIRVQDENDGQSVIKLYVDGKYVEAVRLDEDDDGSGNDHGSFSTYLIKDVHIEKGETIKLKVYGDDGEYVRIDKIDFKGEGKTEIVSEPTKEGVTIKLLDLDGNVVATTTTDANGNYKFDDVPVGQYKIMGVAPDGTEFTIQDVDGNSKDDIDSDVDSNGMSNVITVTKDSKTDIDLGVCEKEEEPGSLSGRYFCDTNDNDQDDGNGNEPAVAGVLVMLLDFAGNPAVDFDGNAVASVFTDVNGEYAFGNLAAGTYTVKFTDPDGVTAGKTLVTPNVGDDASDSDAIGDNTESVIEGIVVVAGEDTPDNDAGIEYVNQPPVPNPEEAETCADETVTVDVLANDTDPENDVLSVTMVNGDNFVGGELTTSSGVVITLNADGTLTFDGEAAYASLDIGETATEIFTYKIDDGNGNTAESTVTVTFCGDANSVESWCDALPTSAVYKVSDGFGGSAPYDPSAYDLLIVNGETDDRLDGVLFEQAYCLDFTKRAQTDRDMADAPELTADVFCFDNVSGASLLAGLNGVNGAAVNNIDSINWILNQDFENNGAGSVDGNFTGAEVQFAIWELMNGINSDPTFAAAPELGQIEDVDYIVQQAINNGDGFEAGVGDLIGVIINPNPATSANAQPFIVAIDFETYDCLC